MMFNGMFHKLMDSQQILVFNKCPLKDVSTTKISFYCMITAFTYQGILKTLYFCTEYK